MISTRTSTATGRCTDPTERLNESPRGVSRQDTQVPGTRDDEKYGKISHVTSFFTTILYSTWLNAILPSLHPLNAAAYWHSETRATPMSRLQVKLQAVPCPARGGLSNMIKFMTLANPSLAEVDHAQSMTRCVRRLSAVSKNIDFTPTRKLLKSYQE